MNKNKDNIRIGIVGIGNMGSIHAKSIYNGNIKGLTLVAVCDIDENKKTWVKENLGDICFYSDYKDLINSGMVDMILIATPHYLHPVIAIDAFEKGLHVLSEKPAGVYTKQVEKMNTAAKKSGNVFGLMFNQRTNPLYQKAHDLVKEGKIGELKRCVWIITSWYRTQAYYDSGSWRATWDGEGGGVLINQCPHNLDLWQWIFGMPTKIRSFCSYGKYHNIEVEDDVTAYAEYENGATAVFITTTGECPGTNRLEITGDKGKIVIEDGKLKFWTLSIPEREWCFTAKQGFTYPETKYEEFSFDNQVSGHDIILQNFTNAILYGEKLIAPGEEGINGLKISNAIHLSSWTDDWVELPIDKELYLQLLNKKRATSKGKDEITSSIENLQSTYNN